MKTAFCQGVFKNFPRKNKKSRDSTARQKKFGKGIDKKTKIVYNKSVEVPVTVASYQVKKKDNRMLVAGGYLFLFPLLFKQAMIEKIKVAISNRSRQVMYSIATPPSCSEEGK